MVSLQAWTLCAAMLGAGETAGYIESGSWGKKALADAAHHGDAYSAWSGAGSRFTRMPQQDEIEIRPGSRSEGSEPSVQPGSARSMAPSRSLSRPSLQAKRSIR